MNLVLPSMTQEQNTSPSPSPRHVPHRVTSFQLPSHDYGSNRKTLLNAFSITLTFSILSCNLLSVRKWPILFLWLGLLDNMLDMLGSTCSFERINRVLFLVVVETTLCLHPPPQPACQGEMLDILRDQKLAEQDQLASTRPPTADTTQMHGKRLNGPHAGLVIHLFIHSFIYSFIHSINEYR